MNRSKWLRLHVIAGVAALLTLPVLAAPPVADVSLGAMQVEWQPTGEFAGMTLRVSGPLGVVEQGFAAGENPLFDLGSMETVADGLYTWEIVAAPRLDDGVRRAMAEARAAGDGAAEGRLRASGALPNAGDMVQSGSFRVVGGVIQQPTGEAERSPGLRRVTSDATGGDLRRVTAEDQVIPDDLIVQGSACVGIDCVNNENFGFDTIRMKENNTRIDFTDTSSTAGFPSQDWEIAANDSAGGGRNALIVSDENTQLFVVESGDAANALYVDDLGRVGLRTSNPVLDIHISTGNTPAIRLEQTNASGFTAQTWDVAGNEANFFVRDVTGGSLLPFRIRPGAPTSSVDISADGDVGVGTASPDAKLEVVTNAASAATVRYTNTNAGGFAGGEYFEDATQGLFVGLDNANNLARINAVSSYPLVILTNSSERIRFPAPGGNFITAANGASLTAGGIWADASSRDYKQDIESLSLSEAMSAFSELVPVSFRYRESPDERYVGFIAEDVPELVAMSGRKSLAAIEMVALLTRVVQEQERRLQDLTTANHELREAVEGLLDSAPE